MDSNGTSMGDADKIRAHADAAGLYHVRLRAQWAISEAAAIEMTKKWMELQSKEHGVWEALRGIATRVDELSQLVLDTQMVQTTRRDLMAQAPQTG